MSGRSSAQDGEGDDFTRISGIGKALDRRLHEAGVHSYADLAALNPEGIASLLAGPVAVRPGRISDEDWTGQAAKLADQAAMAEAGAAEADTAETGTAGGEVVGPAGGEVVMPTAESVPASSLKASAAHEARGLPYQSFVVRILLHESDGQIASTTVQHVGSGTERRWPGLDKAALLDFISSYLPAGAAESLPVRQADGPGEAGPREAPMPNPSGGQAGQPEDEPVARAADSRAAARATAEDSVPSTPASSQMPSEVSMGLARDVRVPRPGEPFTVSITLDLTDVEPPTEPRVRFSAVVLARSLSGAAPQVVAEGKGIVSADMPLITLHSAGLPAGTYRLEAVTQLVEPHGERDLVASAEGGILVVSGSGAEPSAGRRLQRIP